MKISVIIPSLNEELFLPQLLSDLSKQTIKPEEIIVVDAGSKDKTLPLIEGKYDNLVILNTDPNIGAQRTFGGEQAKGDILCFLDSDVRLQVDFFERAILEFNNKKLSLACPTYYPYSLDDNNQVIKSTDFILFAYKFLDVLFYLFQKLLPSGAGSGILVTKKLFLASGGFREDLKFDDIAFIRKASKFGKFGKLKTILYVSDRRFRKYGPVKTFLSYLILSVFFLFNAFKASEIINYKFAEYYKK